MKAWALMAAVVGWSAAGEAQDGGVADAGPVARPIDRAWVESPFEETDADDPIGLGTDTGELQRMTERDRAEAEARALREAEARRKRGPDAPGVRAAEGEVLTAISGVREVEHGTRVRLEHGLAWIEEAMRFANRTRTAAEVRMRIAVPEGAGLAALEVCRGATCRRGVASPAASALSAYDESVMSRGPVGAAPVAEAQVLRDRRGLAIDVRAAPVTAGGELVVRMAWIAAAPMHGGVVRLGLPARGSDPRAAQMGVRVEAPGLTEVKVDGTRLAADGVVAIDPWQAIEIAAEAPAGTGAARAIAWTARCGDRRCGRAFVAAPPREAVARDLILLVDASPSMEGPARGRVATTVAALLEAAPEGTRVRAAAFAARTQVLIGEAVDRDAVRLAAFGDVTSLELGSATRFEAGWEVASRWLAQRAAGLRPLVVVLGDGGITDGTAGRAAIAAADRNGVEVVFVGVGDRPPWPLWHEVVRRTGGTVIPAGAEAGAQAELEPGRGGRLESRLAAIFAPVVAREVVVRAGTSRISLGSLRAGESLVWEGAIDRGSLRVAAGGARAAAREAPAALRLGLAGRLGTLASIDGAHTPLAAVEPADLREPRGACGAVGPAYRRGGVSSDTAPIALAGARACAMPPAPAPAARQSGRGMPAETVLAMLRTRVVPIARRCFRADRLGRAQYRARAEFVVELADREVVAADVRGAIRSELRQCLSAAVDVLDIPPFEGAVVVRYPIVSAPEPPPPVLHLETNVAAEIDRLFSDASERGDGSLPLGQ